MGYRLDGSNEETGLEGFLIDPSDASAVSGKVFDPLKEAKGLFCEFAETSFTPDGVSNFANRWGMLTRDRRERIRLKDDPDGETGFRAEPLVEWYYEIAAMRQAVRMWNGIRREDRNELSN
jgi:hypothetical protein